MAGIEIRELVDGDMIPTQFYAEGLHMPEAFLLACDHYLHELELSGDWEALTGGRPRSGRPSPAEVRTAWLRFAAAPDQSSDIQRHARAVAKD